MEGVAAIRVIGGALAPLTERGVISEDDFPLLRALHAFFGAAPPLETPG